MKIKTTKKLTLTELINGVWEGKIKYGEYKSQRGISVFVWSLGFEASNSVTIQADELFTITVEEDLSEDTEFEELWEVYYNKLFGEMETYKNGDADKVYSTSISQIIQENLIDSDNITLAIYYGTTLIWSHESGIPESGVLEVSAE